MSMFNVRYLVVPPKMSIALQEEDNYELLSAGTGYRLYENRSSLPLAWPVQRLVSYTGIADVKEAMYDCSMNPGYEAAVQEDDMKKIGFPVMLSNGKVRLVEHHNGRIVLNTDFPGSGFVVVAEQYYPGWKARVDKTPVSIYQ
ncbi:MAG: YfhO family protein, partial [Gammaproteobacteria bacterium]|nr:YfhO family protein [Gammaproteobacteria bacterium]